MCTPVAYWGTVSKALVVLLWYIHAGPSPGVAFTLVWAVSVTGCGGCTGGTGNVPGRKYHLKNPCATPRISVMSSTFMESSLMDCTGEGLDSCVSEIMKGLDPASRTLWTFPESAWARDGAVIQDKTAPIVNGHTGAKWAKKQSKNILSNKTRMFLSELQRTGW